MRYIKEETINRCGWWFQRYEKKERRHRGTTISIKTFVPSFWCL